MSRSGEVTFINCFEVPPGREDEFLALWGAVNRYMRERPGFLWNRLHRALDPDARFRFVNYVRWQSVGHWQAAHDDGFRALVQQPAWRAFPFTGAVFEVAAEFHA